MTAMIKCVHLSHGEDVVMAGGDYDTTSRGNVSARRAKYTTELKDERIYLPAVSNKL